MTLLRDLLVFLAVLSMVCLCAYVLIDRICECIENCAIAKAYQAYLERGGTVNVGDLKEK